MIFIKKLLILFLISLAGIVQAPSLNGALLANREEFVIEYLNNKAIEKEIVELKSSEFTPDRLIRYLELKDVDNHEIVIRQAILESGWFKSGLFKRGNNLFGMRVPKVRETTSEGFYLGHARYNHWTDSVDDYLLWKDYWKSKGKYNKDYYKFLDNVGYAIASNYIKILKNINLDRLNGTQRIYT